mgnify:CR=1 FL=1
MLTHPFAPIHKLGPVTLIGPDHQVDQNDYSPSVALDLVAACDTRSAAPISGEILHVTLISTEAGDGSVLVPAGVLYLFSADPAITAGDTAITAAERATVIAQIEVETTDWKADANGASATVYTKPVAFHPLPALYAAWFHEDATAYNDAAGNNEQLQLVAWLRRDN